MEHKLKKIVQHLTKYDHTEAPIRFTQEEIEDLKENGLTIADILNFYSQKALEEEKARNIIGIKKMFDRYISNDIEIIEQKLYKDITYIIKRVSGWHCAYIIVGKKIWDKYHNEDFICDQEITFAKEIKDCDFIKDKKIGEYVIGWDYAHNYNMMGTKIDVIRNDIKEIINSLV